MECVVGVDRCEKTETMKANDTIYHKKVWNKNFIAKKVRKLLKSASIVMS